MRETITPRGTTNYWRSFNAYSCAAMRVGNLRVGQVLDFYRPERAAVPVQNAYTLNGFRDVLLLKTSNLKGQAWVNLLIW